MLNPEQWNAILKSGRDPEYYLVVDETADSYIITDRMYQRDRIGIKKAPQNGNSNGATCKKGSNNVIISQKGK